MFWKELRVIKKNYVQIKRHTYTAVIMEIHTNSYNLNFLNDLMSDNKYELFLYYSNYNIIDKIYFNILDSTQYSNCYFHS